MSQLAVIICGVTLWPFLAMWRAYCVLVLWAWFVAPATGINPPSMYLLVGSLMALHLMLPVHREPKEDGNAFAVYLRNVIGYGLFWPALALFFGWVWKWLQWGLV